MFEVALFHGGAFDTEAFTAPDGTKMLIHDLAEAQEHAKSTLTNGIRLAVLADQLGYDYWFNTEHHFQPEGSEFNPNPLNNQMTTAALTKRIRLGQSANILTWHHPVRIAEQAAMLDVVSGGRLEFGAGRGYQTRETEVLGGPMGATSQDQERNRSFFEEALEIIIKCWTEPSFRHEGEFFTIPPTYTTWDNLVTNALFNQPGAGRRLDQVLDLDRGTIRELTVLPQPVQQPHPQIWMPATSPRSIDFAAAKGLNSYMIVTPNERAKLTVQHYMDAAEKAGWPDRNGDGRPFKYGWDSERKRGFGLGRYIHIVDKGVGNKEMAIRGQSAVWEYYNPFGFPPTTVNFGEPYPERVTTEHLIEQGTALFGPPDMIIEELLKSKDIIGLEDLLVWCFFEMPGIGTEGVAEQLEVFASEIAPVLAKELGGRVERPESTVDLSPAVRSALPAAG